MSVLVIRREPLAQRTATRLKEAGLNSVLMPMFDLQDTKNEIEPLAYNGVVISSSAVFDVLIEREKRGSDFQWLLEIPCHCVGAQTAKNADQFGMKKIGHVSNDVDGLVEALAGSTKPKERVLYLAGSKRKPQIEQFFQNSPNRGELVEIYNITQMTPAESDIKQTFVHLNNSKKPLIFLYSEEQASWFWQQFAQNKAGSLPEHMEVVAISENVAILSESFVSFKIHVSKQKDEASMIEEALRISSSKNS